MVSFHPILLRNQKCHSWSVIPFRNFSILSLGWQSDRHLLILMSVLLWYLLKEEGFFRPRKSKFHNVSDRWRKCNSFYCFLDDLHRHHRELMNTSSTAEFVFSTLYDIGKSLNYLPWKLWKIKWKILWIIFVKCSHKFKQNRGQ